MGVIMCFEVNLVSGSHIFRRIAICPCLAFFLANSTTQVLKTQRKALRGLKSGGVYVGFV